MEQDSLVSRIQAGDANAEAEFVSRYGKMIYYTALAEIGDEDRALEVTSRALQESVSAIREGTVPEDITTHLQQEIRRLGTSVADEASIMAAVREDVAMDARVDSIFAEIAPESPFAQQKVPEPAPEPEAVAEAPDDKPGDSESTKITAEFDPISQTAGFIGDSDNAPATRYAAEREIPVPAPMAEPEPEPEAEPEPEPEPEPETDETPHVPDEGEPASEEAQQPVEGAVEAPVEPSVPEASEEATEEAAPEADFEKIGDDEETPEEEVLEDEPSVAEPEPVTPASPFAALDSLPTVSEEDLAEELASIDGAVADAEEAYGEDYVRPDLTTPIPADAIAALAAKSEGISIDAQADAIIGELASSARTVIDAPTPAPETAPTVVDAVSEADETVVDVPAPVNPAVESTRSIPAIANPVAAPDVAAPAPVAEAEPVHGAVDLVSDDELANVNSDLHEKFYGQADSKIARTGHAGGVIGIVFIVILAILLVWLLLGFLIRLEAIPSIDLGYGWFNENIYPLF